MQRINPGGGTIQAWGHAQACKSCQSSQSGQLGTWVDMWLCTTIVSKDSGIIERIMLEDTPMISLTILEDTGKIGH